MKKSRKITALLLSVIMIVSAAALVSCSDNKEYPVKIGSLTIEKEPERIIILDNNLADIISCIGYDVKMAGRSDDVNIEGLQVVPSVGAANDPSPASLDEVEGELVFAADTLDETIAKNLRKNGVSLVIPEKASTLKQLKALYKKLGTILGGNKTGAAKGYEAYQKLISTLKDIKSAVDDKNIVRTVCYFYIDNGTLKTFNGSCWGGTLLDFTGAVNVFGNQKNDNVDIDALTLAKPDYIFCDNKAVLRYLKDHKEISKLSALKNNTFIIPLSEINLQGNSALDVLEKMLRNMYPEDFLD